MHSELPRTRTYVRIGHVAPVDGSTGGVYRHSRYATGNGRRVGGIKGEGEERFPRHDVHAPVGYVR
eukprot:17916-Eustigmatos_ZCMA.PRE.1